MEYEKNQDGTDKLDENGNPIPVKSTNEGLEADEKIAAALAPLVEEIKGLRQSNGILKDLLDKKEETPPIPENKPPLTEDEKLAEAVKKVLAQQKSSDAQVNKTTAFEKFVTENKEFHPENDSLGIKREALKKKFAQFNTDGLQTVDEFLSVIGDAKRLLNGNDSQSDTTDRQTIIPQPPIPKNLPPKIVVGELTPREQKLMAQTGRTKEQILKMKEKHPEMFEQIMEYVRD